MTLEEYVADYANQKKWLVKADDAAGGTGSGSTDRLPADSAQREKAELERLASIADPAQFQQELQRIASEKQAAR
jgi:hypothetical protein